MDPATLYAIMTMANGTPKVFTTKMHSAASCAYHAGDWRQRTPGAVIWCRSRQSTYIPDAMDMLGMPPR